MDHRKNFVRAIKAVQEMDQLLAQMDQVFQSYHQLVLQKAKAKIDGEYFAYKVRELGDKRKLIFKKYDQIAKTIQEIQDEYGGEIKD